LSFGIGRGSDQAVHDTGGAGQQFLQQEGPEEAGGTGEQYLRVPAPGPRRQRAVRRQGRRDCGGHLAARLAACLRQAPLQLGDLRGLAVVLRRGGGAGVFHRLRDVGDRGGRVERAQVHLDAHIAAEQENGAGGLDGGAAEGEEVVVAADVVAVEDGGED